MDDRLEKIAENLEFSELEEDFEPSWLSNQLLHPLDSLETIAYAPLNAAKASPDVARGMVRGMGDTAEMLGSAAQFVAQNTSDGIKTAAEHGNPSAKFIMERLGEAKKLIDGAGVSERASGFFNRAEKQYNKITEALQEGTNPSAFEVGRNLDPRNLAKTIATKGVVLGGKWLKDHRAVDKDLDLAIRQYERAIAAGQSPVAAEKLSKIGIDGKLNKWGVFVDDERGGFNAYLTKASDILESSMDKFDEFKSINTAGLSNDPDFILGSSKIKNLFPDSVYSDIIPDTRVEWDTFPKGIEGPLASTASDGSIVLNIARADEMNFKQVKEIVAHEVRHLEQVENFWGEGSSVNQAARMWKKALNVADNNPEIKEVVNKIELEYSDSIKRNLDKGFFKKRNEITQLPKEIQQEFVKFKEKVDRLNNPDALTKLVENEWFLLKKIGLDQADYVGEKNRNYFLYHSVPGEFDAFRVGKFERLSPEEAQKMTKNMTFDEITEKLKETNQSLVERSASKEVGRLRSLLKKISN